MPMHLARLGALAAAALAVATLAAGCAPPCYGQPASCRTGAQTADDVVCVSEPETGTHVVETRCYPRSEVDDRRKTDRAILERAQMNSNRPHRGPRDP
jgi:hypothetical protein